MLAEAWDESKGFLHRIGGPRLEGSLDDQVLAAAALLDAYELTLEPRYFHAAESAMRLAVERYGDPEGGGFFDRARDAAPMGGLEVRRKPLQDSPTPGGNSVAAIVLERLYGFTGEPLYHQWAAKTLEAFIGLIPRYGLFAGTYALAALLHARHPLQVVVTGAAGDPTAGELEKAAHEVYRFGKAVLRRHTGKPCIEQSSLRIARNSAASRRNRAASSGLRGDNVLSACFRPGKTDHAADGSHFCGPRGGAAAMNGIQLERAAAFFASIWAGMI